MRGSLGFVTLLVAGAVGIIVVAIVTPGALLRLRPARLGVRTHHDPNGRTRDNAPDLVRLDDDGGWHATLRPR